MQLKTMQQSEKNTTNKQEIITKKPKKSDKKNTWPQISHKSLKKTLKLQKKSPQKWQKYNKIRDKIEPKKRQNSKGGH